MKTRASALANLASPVAQGYTSVGRTLLESNWELELWGAQPFRRRFDPARASVNRKCQVVVAEGREEVTPRRGLFVAPVSYAS